MSDELTIEDLKAVKEAMDRPRSPYPYVLPDLPEYHKAFLEMIEKGQAVIVSMPRHHGKSILHKSLEEIRNETNPAEEDTSVLRGERSSRADSPEDGDNE